jgi:hypothetical protein
LESINKELKLITDQGKQNRVSITTIKNNIIEIEKDYCKKTVFRLAKNRLDLLHNNFEE